MNLRAEFQDPAAAETAVRDLAGAGFGPGDIEIFSVKPVELAPGVLDRPSWMSLLAVLGAVVNGGLATAFMYYTQHDYPLVTGAMPITSAWATGVITFELTMAGAVAGTVLGFLWEGGFFRRPKDRPAPRLRDEAVVLQVHCQKESAPLAIQALQGAGASAVETLD